MTGGSTIACAMMADVEGTSMTSFVGRTRELDELRSLFRDGKRLVTGGREGAVKVWDPATGRELLSLRGQAGTVWTVAFSRDGRRLTSVSSMGTVKVWDATTREKKPTGQAPGATAAQGAVAPKE